MLEPLLRLIGIGGRREKRSPVDAEEEWRRAVREQWESLTPEQKARSAEMERMLRNAEPRAYSPDQLRPMTEEELARYNDPERARGMRLLASAGADTARRVQQHQAIRGCDIAAGADCGSPGEEVVMIMSARFFAIMAVYIAAFLAPVLAAVYAVHVAFPGALDTMLAKALAIIAGCVVANAAIICTHRHRR